MRKLLFLFIILLLSYNSHAGTVEVYKDYNTGDTVTADNLDGNFNNIRNQVNGGLDNNNADVDDGFRFIEVLDSLPAAGNEGRVVFDKGTNTLYFDTGSEMVSVAVLQNTQTFTGSNTFEGTTTIGAVDINGSGNIDNTIIGANTAANITGTNVTANTTFKLGTTNQGDILYDNGTSIVRLTPGTDGQFLETNGTSANPSWSSVGMVLVSANSTSAGTNSGNISVNTGVPIKIIVNLKTNASNDTEVYLRCNSLSGTEYTYAQHGWVSDAALDNFQGGQSEIALSDTGDGVEQGSYFFGEYVMMTSQDDTAKVLITGSASYLSGTVSPEHSHLDVSGEITATGGLSDFEIVTTQTSDFDVYVYEMRVQ